MSRKRNSLLEQAFLIESVETMTDEQAAKAYEDRFGKAISVAALRKRRQRMGLKKKGWDGKFVMVRKTES